MIEIDGINQKLKNYTKKAPKVKTVIHWWDLYKGHYVKLNPDLQKQIFQEAIEKAGGRFTWLGEKLKISRRTIAECWRLKRNPQISTLIKVANFIKFSLGEIEKHIIQFPKSSLNFRPKLPFKLHSPEGAEIRAAFLSDGHVEDNPIKCPRYFAVEPELHNRLIGFSKRVFGNFNAQTKFNSKSYVTQFPAPIGDALKLAGVPGKDKRLIKIFVPKDILLGSQKIQASYLRRVFDDEGDVCFDKYGKRAVRITRSTDITNKNLVFSSLKSERWTFVNNSNIPINMLLLGEQLLLYKLGIDARIYSEGVYRSRRKRITAKWRIQIGQQDSVRKFSKIINFNLKVKRRKLSEVLKSYKLHKFSHNEGKKFVAKILNQIYKKKGYFFYGDLSKKFLKIGKSYDLSGYYLRILTRKKLIKKLKRGQYVFTN